MRHGCATVCEPVLTARVCMHAWSPPCPVLSTAGVAPCPARPLCNALCTHTQMCRRGLKRFKFYLFNDALVYTKTKSSLFGGSKLREYPLHKCHIT